MCGVSSLFERMFSLNNAFLIQRYEINLRSELTFCLRIAGNLQTSPPKCLLIRYTG